ncbi:MAG: ABC transporter permease [Deltaproteobacteria bacterium]|nr:MAG: ABC transporter permease [Deltaproteobacteria bacterium]
MPILAMAWRNIWRNGRRSAVTIAAMALGLWVMVLYSGLVHGMLLDMATSVTDMELGELQIVAPGYRDDPSLHRIIEDDAALLERLDALGYASSARLLGGGLAAVDKASAGVTIIGLDPVRDARVSALHTRIERGSWLDPADPRGVVIGGKLARTLHADIGDELLVLSQAADGSIANDLYTIRGTLAPVGDAIDRTTVLMTMEAFRDLMVLPTGAHQVTVRAPPPAVLDDARAAVEAAAPGLEVRTWRELVPVVAQWLDGTRALVGIIYAIMYLAIAILVLNAMLMAVFERIREFGVMKAIGYPPGTVFSLIMLESALQTAVATGVGLVLAVPVGLYLQETGIDLGALAGMNIMGLNMMENWRAVYTVEAVSMPLFMLWFMVLAAALLPALRAAAIKPVIAMRYR